MIDPKGLRHRKYLSGVTDPHFGLRGPISVSDIESLELPKDVFTLQDLPKDQEHSVKAGVRGESQPEVRPVAVCVKDGLH